LLSHRIIGILLMVFGGVSLALMYQNGCELQTEKRKHGKRMLMAVEKLQYNWKRF
jgi:hypothetical protein